MVENGSFGYPPEYARKLSSQLRRQVLVDLGIRYLDLERYALDPVPDRVVRVRNHRPVLQSRNSLYVGWKVIMFSRRRRALICPSPVKYFTRLSERRCPCSTSLDETNRQLWRSARSVLTALFDIASFGRIIR